MRKNQAKGPKNDIRENGAQKFLLSEDDQNTEEDGALKFLFPEENGSTAKDATELKTFFPDYIEVKDSSEKGVFEVLFI